MSPARKRSESRAPDRFQWDSDTLRKNNIDADEAERLAQEVSALSDKRRLEEINEVWQESQQLMGLWTPYLAAILKHLRKKGVDVDSLRALIEQSALEEKPENQRERLAQEFSKQRALILEAIAEVVDVSSLERQIRGIVSEKQPGLALDSVLAVTGGGDASDGV